MGDRLSPGDTAPDFTLPDDTGSSVTLDCSTYARYPGGDHSILVGAVSASYQGNPPPTVYTDRAFHSLNRL